MPSVPIPSPIAVLAVTPPNVAPSLGAPATPPPVAAAQPQLPPPAKATAPAGSITGDTDKFIETQILAVVAARHACQKLAEKLLGGFRIDTLVINNGIDRTAIANYKSITVLLSAIHVAYLNMTKEAETALQLPLPQAPLAAASAEASSELSSMAGTLVADGLPLMALPALTAGVQSIAGFVNLFRTDTEFKNQQVTINEQTIVTLLVPFILGTKVNQTADRDDTSPVKSVFYPGLYPMDEMSPTVDSSLMKLITQFVEDQANGDARSAQCKNVLNALIIREQGLVNAITGLRNQLESATEPTIRASIQNQINSKINERLPIQQKIDRLRQSAANLDTLKTNTSSLIALLTHTDTTTQMTLLAPLLRVERLQAALSIDKTFVLDLTVTATGTTRIRRNIFLNAKAAHSGGVSISARLFDNRGALVMGEVVNNYIGFTDSRQIHDLADYESLDANPG